MKKMIRALAILSAPALLAIGFAITSAPAAATSHAASVEHLEFDDTYVIVNQIEDAPMATGALDVEEVTFTQPLEVRIYHTIPGV